MGTAYEADASNRENEILYLRQYLIAGLKIGYEELENPDPSAPTQTKQIHEWEAVGDIAIREGTTMMCADAFGMSNITSVKLPSTLKAIPYLGFYRCKNLDNVVIPGNVKDIGPNAFSWNESLTNLTIEEGVERIGEMAFFRCNNLNEVTIPKSVTQIDLQAFGWDYVNDYDVRNEKSCYKLFQRYGRRTVCKRQRI
ncbi:MAG: leucine-rich repeat domain-containing protein [Clostridiales bacterium]|nr:MAG: leucine-rich repeat domain-containing protein [Clostridiales bacterium]